MRTRATLPLLLILTLAALAAPGVALADDTTPPVGTLEVEGGTNLTTDGTVVLDVPATDDVGVTIVRFRQIGGSWTDYPYTPQITWTFDVAQVGEQQLSIAVEWRDAAGNASGAQATFWYDSTPPNLQTFKATNDAGPAGTVTFYVGALEETSGVAAVRFSTDNGAHWGHEIAMNDQIVIWDPRDPDVGGKASAVGPLKVLAKVRDGSGQWSNTRSTTVEVTRTLRIDVSSNPTTGHPITLTPDWNGPATFPAGTHCMWEFMTGDDASLFHGSHNESFSYNLTQGPSTGGWCGRWTFTLPWSTVRQYLVAYRVMFPDGSEMNAMLGDSPGAPSFTSAVGSTSRAITASNLPLVYVLPDHADLTVGVPITYRAFAVGGATIRSTDRWHILAGESLSGFYPGATSFTFTPETAGHLTVCLSRGPGSTPMDQLGACYDPTVKRGSGMLPTPGASSGPGSSAPESSLGPSIDPLASPGGSGAVPGQSPAGAQPTLIAIGVGTAQPGTSTPILPADAPASSTSGSPLGVLVLIGLMGAAAAGAIGWRRGWRPRIPRSGPA